MSDADMTVTKYDAILAVEDQGGRNSSEFLGKLFAAQERAAAANDAWLAEAAARELQHWKQRALSAERELERRARRMDYLLYGRENDIWRDEEPTYR